MGIHALVDLNPPVDGFLDSGRFNVTLFASQTQAFPVCQGVYGIEIYSGDGTGQFVDKVVNGKFMFHQKLLRQGLYPKGKKWLL